MNRTDAYPDALRSELGSAYYQTLHGHGSAGELARAAGSAAARHPGQGAPGAAPGHRAAPAGAGQHLRVRDVMTTAVAAVPITASYKQVARLMTDRAVNAVPVIDSRRRVLGVVSEADMLRKQERGYRRIGRGLPRHTRREGRQAAARTAGQLMTAPPITIHPDARLGSAARLMNGHHIRRLPVTDPAGKLIGIVSRRDLLSVFLRPDRDIAAEASAVIAAAFPDSPVPSVHVRDGVVRLTGALPRTGHGQDAARLAAEVDGVVDVIDDLGR
jgi:CBS domain-containing protein